MSSLRYLWSTRPFERVDGFVSGEVLVASLSPRRSTTTSFARIAAAFLVSASALLAQEGAKAEAPAEDPTWKWINFILLAFALGYLMAKSLPPLFRNRTADIQKDITEAQKIKREAEARAADIEKRVNRLGADIEAFRVQAKAEMEQEGLRIREESVRMIEKLQRQAELEIETAGKHAQRDLKAHAAKLALDLAEQRIRARMDRQAANGLVDDFVSDLRKEESRN